MRLNGWQRIGMVASVICGWLAASSALAEEVLYCVDTQAVGFKWDKAGTVRAGSFIVERYTVKLLSDTQRIITRMVGDAAETGIRYACHKTYPNVEEERITCDDGSGTVPWQFNRNTYTRAFLAGPPAGGTDPNIMVVYGTCTKF
jgi:hypothetical protein